MWMKDFTHMSCQRIRTFETIFSSSKTMPAYLQYGKEHVCKLAMSNPLTSLPGPNPSQIDHPWDNLARWIHNRIPSKSRQISGLEHYRQCIPQGVGLVQPNASFEHAQKAHRMHS